MNIQISAKTHSKSFWPPFEEKHLASEEKDKGHMKKIQGDGILLKYENKESQRSLLVTKFRFYPNFSISSLQNAESLVDSRDLPFRDFII